MSDYEPERISELRNDIVALARRLRQSADNETWTSFMVLGAIQRGNGDVTPSQIASEFGLRSSNLAQVLTDLDTRSLIQRRPDPADKRKVRLSLTEAGAALVRETRAKRDRWLVDAITRSLSPEEYSVLMAAGALIRRLASSKQPGGPEKAE